MNNMRGVKVGLIGAGAIGGVIIDRLVNGAEAQAQDIVACETKDVRREEIARRFGVRITMDPADAAAADLIILAGPPLEVTKVLDAIRDRLRHRPVSLIRGLRPCAQRRTPPLTHPQAPYSGAWSTWTSTFSSMASPFGAARSSATRT